MIRIDKHARGLAIGAPEGVDRNELVCELGKQLGRRAYISRGRLLAPLDAIVDVFRALGTERVLWDDELLQRAMRRSHQHDMQLRARLEVAEAMENPLAILGQYPRISKLDPHQVEAVAAIVSPSLQGVALFDEQGTGKTITALAAFDVLQAIGRVARLIVVAPKSVLGAWRDAADQFLGGNFTVSLVDGPASVRRRAILRRHDILLVGYETVVSEERLLDVVLRAPSGAYLLVIDESYFVKNPQTARARALGRLRDACERAVVLCGTPAPNSPSDVVNQIDIADRGVAFRGRAISKERPAAEREVSDALQEAIVLRRLKKDVLPQVPAKQAEKVYVDLAVQQRALYERARDDLMLAVRSVDDRQFRRQLSSFLARRVRLLQICSNPKMLDPLYDEEPAKLRALDRLLQELVEHEGQKVVVWSYFRMSLETIARRYERYGLVRIDGSVGSVEVRMDAVHRFQSDSGTRVFLGNAAAAGAGITLTAAHHAIYESFSNQAAHYMQSVDRIHRRGQSEQVISHVLIARKTVEEAEYHRLVEKEQSQRTLLGDQYEPPVSRDRFLAELSSSE